MAAPLAKTQVDSMLLPLSRPTQTTQRNASLALLKRADHCRFGTLWADLENQFSQGNDQYPIDLTAAYSLLVNFKPPKQEETRRNTRSHEAAVEEEDGMTFVQ